MLSNTEINLVSTITSCGGVGIRRVGRNQGRRVGGSSDSATTMRKATFSKSSVKKNAKCSIQSKHHHSLRRPPRTGVLDSWSTDIGTFTGTTLSISKDAKANFPAVVAPVQLSGLSCRECDALPDHTWDQSRTNVLTPMTFLFLETKVTGTTTDVTGTRIKHNLRSGQGETLLNLSFFKPDTTSKCLNELQMTFLQAAR